MNLKDNEKKEAVKQYFIHNGQLLSIENFDDEKTKLHPSFYEVIRVIDGVPLFLEEHMERLQHSIKLLQYDFPFSYREIEKQMKDLIDANKCYDYNIKIIVNDLHSLQPNLFLYFIASHYPEREQYEKGVPVILYEGERENPNAKVIAAEFRAKVNEEIRKAKAYEAILVNHQGEMTEGSRSNLFFVKDDQLYTAASKDVLVGITRSRIIHLTEKLGYKIIEKTLPTRFLEEIDGLFITGTSPKVLPIASVGEKQYASSNNPVIKAIHDAYNQLIEEYIEKHK